LRCLELVIEIVVEGSTNVAHALRVRRCVRACHARIRPSSRAFATADVRDVT
jgi:hypothetical protein